MPRECLANIRIFIRLNDFGERRLDIRVVHLLVLAPIHDLDDALARGGFSAPNATNSREIREAVAHVLATVGFAVEHIGLDLDRLVQNPAAIVRA